ncbi:hypothetical protein OAM93_03955 [Candidatus Pelagibacter sp.]|nr:hypothetical protein [Candidatus Pelagibacter sp.]
MNFIKKVLSPTIFILSSLILIYTFYKSEIVWDGNKRDYYLTFYLLSLSLIFFSIIFFFINEKIKEYLVIIVISIISSIYGFEAYLTLKIDFFSKEKLYEKKTGKKWDTRNTYEIYKDFRKINENIVVEVTPSDFLKNDYNIFPLSGISFSETISCNENGYYSIYQSDRYGFNNPDSEWDNKEIEYLLVGDSFTRGACVDRPNDMSSVLRNLSNKSVLNLGQGGTGPLIQYGILREYLNTNIKKVIMVYFEGNDLWNFLDEKNNNILSNYLDDLNFSQSLIFRQNEVDHLERKKIDEMEAEITEDEKQTLFKIFIFLRLDKLRTLLNSYLPKNQQQYHLNQKLTNLQIAELKKTFVLSKELVEQNNSKFYFVYLPQFARYKTNYDNKNYNMLKNMMRELKIPFIDIHTEVFALEQNPLKLFPFESPGHYNVIGHKKVAEAIYKLTKD